MREPPPIPETGWIPPAEFPRLDEAEAIALDTETRDEGLNLGRGPGDVLPDGGYIAGIGVGVPEGDRWYFPMRHERGRNFDVDQVLRWAREELGRPGQPKVGANLLYDVGWLAGEGVEVQGPFIDVQYAEALLDENAMTYALNSLGRKYVGEGKTDEVLYQWLSQTYGGRPTRSAQAGRIWRAPATIVGPYAEGDLDLPLRIWEKQRPLIDEQGLRTLFEIECGLIPLLTAMRRRGVRVDLDRVGQVQEIISDRLLASTEALGRLAGGPVDIWSAESIARAFDRAGEQYPRTKKGAPSFQKGWLENGPEIGRLVAEVRRWGKAQGTFIDGMIRGHLVGDRIHASIHPLRSDEHGTVSGRFSYSDPNLQQVPARDEELGPLIRSVFVPDLGDLWWRGFDYSQIEYRFLAHYARGPGADEVRNLYRENPKTDFHETCQDRIREMTGRDLGRKPTKNVNFGMIYGMGKDRLAANLGLSAAVSEDFFGAYHQGAPFVRRTSNAVKDAAAARGFIRTILGRRARFDRWESTNFARAKKEGTYASPDEIDGPARRAWLHKSLNRLLQGGAADAMKKAMLDLWESGVLDETGVPLLTIHDELAFSDPGTPQSEEAFSEVKDIMETAVKLKVPIFVDDEVGPNWGEAA